MWHVAAFHHICCCFYFWAQSPLGHLGSVGFDAIWLLTSQPWTQKAAPTFDCVAPSVAISDQSGFLPDQQLHYRKAGIEIEALAMLERYQHQKPLYRNCLQKFLSHVHTLPKTLPLGSSLMPKPIQPSFL